METIKTKSGVAYTLKNVTISFDNEENDKQFSIGVIAISDTGNMACNHTGAWIFPNEMVAKYWIAKKWR